MDLNNVKTFNEKIQWLKINDRNPLYTNMFDKYFISTIGGYDSFEDINFSTLQNQFVIKTIYNLVGVLYVKIKKYLI